MFELITSNHVLVEHTFPTLREALAEGKAMMAGMYWLDHIWFREKNNVLMLGRITKKTTHFSHLTSIPTELL
jgi:hypothetical protein